MVLVTHSSFAPLGGFVLKNQRFSRDDADVNVYNLGLVIVYRPRKQFFSHSEMEPLLLSQGQ